MRNMPSAYWYPSKITKFITKLLKYIFCFILVYIPYRNLVLMATNLCVFIFFPFLLFFVLFCFISFCMLSPVLELSLESKLVQYLLET